MAAIEIEPLVLLVKDAELLPVAELVPSGVRDEADVLGSNVPLMLGVDALWLAGMDSD